MPSLVVDEEQDCFTNYHQWRQLILHVRDRERDSRGKKRRYDDIFEQPRAESHHLALSGREVRWRWAENYKSAARKIEKL